MARIVTATLVASTATPMVRDSATGNALVITNVDGLEAVYIRTDGTAATLKGNDCYALPKLAGALLTIPDYDGVAATSTISVISAGTPTVNLRTIKTTRGNV